MSARAKSPPAATRAGAPAEARIRDCPRACEWRETAIRIRRISSNSRRPLRTPAAGTSEGSGRRGGSAADASLSAVLRGDWDDGPLRHRPTTAAFDSIHVRTSASPTDAMSSKLRGRRRALLSRPPGLRPQRLLFNYELAAYHQSAGWTVCVVLVWEVSAFAATAPPTKPKKTPARTASASRRTRGVIKMTPFTWYETALSLPKSPTVSGIRHATHRISPACLQTQTLLLAASCLSPTAMRMAT
jgi:hypothetical protein